ncbi:MAG: aminotransferase class V-fold PLP-dependent enzyme [Oscillospiraceae bacterium]
MGVPQPENVVITGSATHGLNLAIRSLLGPGDRVVISGYEHNAVTRPLHAIPGLSVTVIDTPPFRPDLAAEEFCRAIRQKRPQAVICTHVSNVFGAVLPVKDIARCCRETDTPLIVDASQSAGVLPVDLAGWGRPLWPCPVTRACTAPRARDSLLCGAEGKPLPLYGGTGSMSRLQDMPPDLPDRLEPGTHNMPGIAGLLEGIRFVRRQGVESIAARERQVALRAARGLESLPGVRVFWDRELRHQTGVVSFVTEGRDCEAVGRPWPGGASPCGRGFTARPWPIARRGRWKPEPCG